MQTDPALVGPPIATIDELPIRLAAIGAALPATDGLAYFNRMYRLVTDAVRQQVTTGDFEDPHWMAVLDVTFGNLYLDALRAWSTNQPTQQIPRAWAAMFEQRENARIAPIQFALAGMNAHINRDLPVAVVSTCKQLGTEPDAGSHHADFARVNAILAWVEPTIRRSFEDALTQAAAPNVQDVVANFDMLNARETAWANAETLWLLERAGPAQAAAYLVGLDHLVGFAGRGLLVALLH